MASEFDLRKGVHIKLLPKTHAEFRAALLKKGLSMQEVFEEFAQRVVLEDRNTTRLLEDIIERKREKIMEKLTTSDAESIFDIIEMESVLSKRKLNDGE